MHATIDDMKAIDPELVALGLLLRLHGVKAEFDQIRQKCGNAPIGITQMLRGAKKFGLKACIRRTNWEGLAATQLPGIAMLRDGSFLIIGRATQDEALVVWPPSQKTEQITRAEFEAVWDGQLVVMARRVSLSDRARGFFDTLTNISSRTLGWVQSARHADEGRVEIPSEPAGTDDSKADDSGLGALVILLRCHGIGAEAGQIRHRCGTAKIGITEMLRCAKELGLKARARTTNWERLAKTPLPGIAALRDGRFLILGKVAEDKVLVQHPSSSATRSDDAGAIRIHVGWPPRPDGSPRELVGPIASLRHHLVPRRDPQIPPPARRGAGRLVLPSAVRACLAVVLPGRHRQGARASQHEHARCADHRPYRHRAVRGNSRRFAHLSVRAYDKPHRCRARRAAVSPPDGAADRLFPGETRRRFSRPRARAREHPQFPDQLGAYPRHRSVLHLRIPGGHVLLFAALDLRRARLLSILYRDLGWRDAAVPPAARREVPARRREPGFPGRERDRRRDAQGHGGRTADAAPLGGAARRLCCRELPRHQPRQYGKPGGAVRQQGGHCRHPLFWRQACHRGRPHRRRACGL